MDSASRKRKYVLVFSKTRRGREKGILGAREMLGAREEGREGGKRLQGGHYEFLVKLKSQSALLYMQNKTYSHVFAGLYWLKSNKGDLH